MTWQRWSVWGVVVVVALVVASLLGGPALAASQRQAKLVAAEQALLQGVTSDGGAVARVSADSFRARDYASALRGAAVLVLLDRVAAGDLAEAVTSQALSALASNDLVHALQARLVLERLDAPRQLAALDLQVSERLVQADALARVLQAAVASVEPTLTSGGTSGQRPMMATWRQLAELMGLQAHPVLMGACPGPVGVASRATVRALQARFEYLLVATEQVVGAADRSALVAALVAQAHVLAEVGWWPRLEESWRQRYAVVTARPGPGWLGWGVLLGALVGLGAVVACGGCLARRGPDPVDPAAETLEHVDPVDIESGAITMAASSAGVSGLSDSVSGSRTGSAILDLDETEFVDPFDPARRASPPPARWVDPAETAVDLDPPDRR